jgi:hypothetical protein
MPPVRARTRPATKGSEVTDTGLTGSQLAEIRHERSLRRQERRAEQLAERKAQVLTRDFLQKALTSKRGLKHVAAAVGLEAGGYIPVTTRELRDLVQSVFPTNQKGK